MESLSTQSAAWVAGLRHEDLPADVAEATMDAVGRLQNADSLDTLVAHCR